MPRLSTMANIHALALDNPYARRVKARKVRIREASVCLENEHVTGMHQKSSRRLNTLYPPELLACEIFAYSATRLVLINVQTPLRVPAHDAVFDCVQNKRVQESVVIVPFRVGLHASSGESLVHFEHVKLGHVRESHHHTP